ncbi:MAG: twin-arginine translocase subunit TatC [Chloroflexi bacterium]|nr:twin-arginine translocase subunit TatC [Chloroflexota bacterium]
MSDGPDDREMTIFGHLAELRRRLVFAGLATLVGMAIAAAFLTWPVIGLLTEPAGIKLIALRPTETFVTYMKVALVTGAGLAMPVIVVQSLLFVLPALHSNERKILFLAVPSITIAFILGLAFGFFVVVPSAVRFLLGFGGDVIDPFWSVEEYLSFVSTFLFWIGVSFETPIVVFFLAKLGVITAAQLSGFRRYALIGAFVLAAIITPTPDPFNMTIVAIPIYLLYELGILLARFA